MLQTVRFCHGCNEKFAVFGDPLCPQCGQTLAPLGDAPTADFSNLAARGTYAGGLVEPAGLPDKLIGKRLATYRLEALLGKGGMARVYRATHLMLERPCAVKVLHPNLVARQAEYVRMFFAEARAAASLVHPHVVTVHTIGQDQGLHLIEMEYVAGQSLERLLEEYGALDPVWATSLMVQIASALAEAHRRNMVHRDIKPSNVLVTPAGKAKLADFGLAKQIVARHGDTSTPLAGTPYYMAPELFEGEPASKPSDVYAMGVTFFYLLSGALPLVDDSITGLGRRKATEPAPDVRSLRPEVPEEAASVIARCLLRRPAERYRDAAELHDELKAVYGSLRSVETLVREALAGHGLAWEGRGRHFTVQVSLPGGRSQQVHIESCQSPALAQRVVRIYSTCCPARESYYQRALELNAAVPHGAIALETIEGRAYFVMGNCYPRATCDPEEVLQSVLMIARHADAIEHHLTGGDVH